MQHFTIMADAFSDLGEELQKQYDIVVVPCHIMLPGGKDIPSFHTWEKFDREKYYADLKNDPQGFATSPANVAEFMQAFEGPLSKGEDILLVTISAGISGTLGFAEQAKKEMLKKYPEAKIACVDSRRFGPALGLLAIYASEQRAQGKSFEETVEYLEKNKNCLHQAGWLDDLSFVAKKGRISHAKAFFGTLAGVKPIGEFDYNGLTTVIGKAKGPKAAYKLLLHYVGKTGINLSEQTIVIAHTDRLEQAKVYADMLKEAFHPKDIRISEVFPMCSVSIGPGLMAAYYMGTPISEGLDSERAIIDEFLKAGK